MRRLLLILLLTLSAVLAGCIKTESARELAPSPEAARKELGRMNVPYSEAAFLDSASNGDLVAVNLFLAAGMSPDVRDTKGRLAYVFTDSINTDMVSIHLEFERALEQAVDAKGVLPSGCMRPEVSATPLMAASISGRADVVKALLAKGARVNTKDGIQMTALFYAAWKGHTEVVKQLIEGGADVNVFTELEDGSWPLKAAAYGGYADTAGLLIERGALLNPKTKRGDTAMHWAAYGGSTEVMRLLLNRGADVNVRDFSKRTPLINAAVKGHGNVIRQLIAAGADVNARDSEGKSALTKARESGHSNLFAILIQAGAR